MDQTVQSAFISNIHPSKQHKYLLGHQEMSTFTMLMEAAATHASTEEKMNYFPELDQKASYKLYLLKSEQYRYESRTNRPPRPYQHAEHRIISKEEGSNRRTQFINDAPNVRKPEQLINPRLPSKYTSYALLVHNLEYIFHVDNRNKIPPARPLKSPGKNQD